MCIRDRGVFGSERVKTSNLCSEITLHTSKDETAVCCLSSVNLEYYDEWKDNDEFIYDIMLFLDNVLDDFIELGVNAGLSKAVKTAFEERSVGLGAMGFHSYLQSKMIPFESALAKSINLNIFRHLKLSANHASSGIARLRGNCPDCVDSELYQRFTHKLAIAPTASISIIANNVSPSIEPYTGNIYVSKTLSGSHVVKNRHLTDILESLGKNNDEIWNSIAANDGSIAHLDFLSDDVKEVFKTAREIDQNRIIEHAADRQKYICQSQSVNLFLRSDISKRDLHNIHFSAWSKGLKSLYYLRATAGHKADNISKKSEVYKYDECLACE